MCCWICCCRDDPSLRMCPGWPCLCIHYPWVEAARTLEFKRGSLLPTSTCTLYQPWLYEISYNPIYVSWGVKAKHNTGIILSAGTQRSPVVCRLCTHLHQLHTDKHNHVGALWLDYDWQVSEVLTGMIQLTYYALKQEISANTTWHTASST